jgi:hypothetical protein
MADPEVNTHNYTLKNSRQHAGKLITRVPVSYLRWMVRENHSEARYAQAELDRRGSTLPTMDISGHAIDRASLHCLDIYKRTRERDEGLNAWLLRMAANALAAEDIHKEKYRLEGMLFAFDRDGDWPVLKTVIRDKGGQHDSASR